MNINGQTEQSPEVKCDYCDKPAVYALWEQKDWELSEYGFGDHTKKVLNSGSSGPDKQRYCHECATDNGYTKESEEQ